METTTLNMALSTASTIPQIMLYSFYSLQWIFSIIAGIILYLVRLAAWPLSALWTVLLFVCAPVIVSIRLLLSPFIIVINNLPRLQPLYTYFGTAALIGLAAGLILTLSTSATFSLLGLYDRPSPPMCSPDASAQHLQVSAQPRDESRPNTPISPGADIDSLLAGISSSPDSDNLFALTGWRDAPNTKRKRMSTSRMGGGAGPSRFSTILEEDDDSF